MNFDIGMASIMQLRDQAELETYLSTWGKLLDCGPAADLRVIMHLRNDGGYQLHSEDTKQVIW